MANLQAVPPGLSDCRLCHRNPDGAGTKSCPFQKPPHSGDYLHERRVYERYAAQETHDCPEFKPLNLDKLARRQPPQEVGLF